MHGKRLLGIARAFFDEHTVGLIFEPLVADLHERPAQLYSAFALSFALTAWRETVRGTSDGAVFMRTAIVFTLAFGVTESALFIAIVPARLVTLPTALWSAPSMLVGAFTAAVFPASFALGSQNGSSRSLVKFACVAAVCSTLLVGWVTPETNQQFRRGARWQSGPAGRSRVVPMRGLPELPLHDLVRGTGDARAYMTAMAPLWYLWEERHRRLTACVSAFALAPLGFGIGRVRRRRAGTQAIGWWTMMILATAVLQMRGFAPPSRNIHPALGYWAMYTALLITGVLLTRHHEAD